MPQWDYPWNVKPDIYSHFDYLNPNVHMYNWTGTNRVQNAIPGIQQNWWRSPSWGPDVIFHPYYGWQQWGDVKPLYKQAGGEVPWSDFTSWNLTPHLGSDYTQWYKPKGGGGTAGATGGTPMNNYTYTSQPWTMNQQPVGGGFPGYGGQYFNQAQFQYPPQWGMATNTLAPMAYSGMPTYMHPWYQQAQQVAGYDVDKAMAQAREEMGFRGLGKSTAAIERGQQVAGDIYSRMGLEYANQQMNALEQARQRQLAATGQLGTLGQQYFQAPLTTAAQAYQQGMGMQQAQQGMIDRWQQEAMRMMPEASPWLQAAMRFAGIQFPQAIPQMYQPSGLTQFLDALIPF